MGSIEYDLKNMVPKVNTGYSGNIFDPLQVYINKAPGSYGALPPYFLTDKHRRAKVVGIDPGYDLDQQTVRQEFLALGKLSSVMPMKVKRESDAQWFEFPIEPLVTVSGKNVITRRKVAKSAGKGTIKERWSQDDYQVTIQGVLSSADEEFPQGDLQQLLAIFDERQSIEVAQDLLWIFGIKHLAIESANFPHTKGLNNQNFEIKAYSDTPFELFIPL
ncbi:MAG: DUF6046 domain-containing protein [Bacteroides sp.]|nr:DUF6046 domain-containing protein [Bacteroides sp.]